MKKRYKDITHKIWLAFHGVGRVLRMPRYAVFALVLAFVFALLIYFFIQAGFYWPLLVSRLPLLDKFGVIWSMIQQLVGSFFTSFDGFLLFVVALLQGAAFAVMTFAMRRNKRVDVETVSEGGLAMFAAALGLGCVPCGTSLIMPIVTLFFSSSAYAAANVASIIVLVIAFGLSLYSLFRLGYVAYAHIATEPNKKER